MTDYESLQSVIHFDLNVCGGEKAMDRDLPRRESQIVPELIFYYTVIVINQLFQKESSRDGDDGKKNLLPLGR